MKHLILLALLAIIGFRELQAQNSFPSSGNVGIGTTTPSYPLQIITSSNIPAQFVTTTTDNTRISVQNNTGFVNLGIGATTPHPYVWSSTGYFFIGDDGGPTIFVAGMHGGNVGIGTTNPGSYKLAVEGTIAARKVIVTATNPFPDYVFGPNYPLPSLDTLSHFIRTFRHLPEIPVADSVTKNGLDLESNQVILLKKIEELTLYVIEQNQRSQQQERKLEAMARELRELKAGTARTHRSRRRPIPLAK